VPGGGVLSKHQVLRQRVGSSNNGLEIRFLKSFHSFKLMMLDQQEWVRVVQIYNYLLQHITYSPLISNVKTKRGLHYGSLGSKQKQIKGITYLSYS